MAEVNNVTNRRPQLLHKSRSMESFNKSSNSLSPMSCDETLGKSLDLSTNIYSSYMAEMKTEIKQLKLSLETTQSEFENIILENLDLKTQVANMNQELSVLKQLCKSPLTTIRRNMSSSTKKSVRRRLTDSFCAMPLNGQEHTIQNLEQEKVLNRKHENENPPPMNEPTFNQASSSTTLEITTTDDRILISGASEELNQNTNDDGISEQTQKVENVYVSFPEYKETLQVCQSKATELDSRHKIRIVADEVGRGIGKRLQKLLGEKFIVMSVIKPNATIDQVLKECASCKDFTKSDFIIVMAGSNDRNPINVHSYLYCTLNELSHTNVLVTKIYNNRFLNEEYLNRLMRHVCTYSKNTEFVPLDVNDDEVAASTFSLNKLDACRLLNREIYRISYKNNLVAYKNESKLRPEIKTKNQIVPKIPMVSKTTNSDTETDPVEAADDTFHNTPDEFFRV